MGECTNKHFGDILHLYELGMLSDDDHQQFEVHLIECEDCFNKVQQFKDVAKHIRFYDEVQEVVQDISKNEDMSSKTIRTERKRLFGNKIWRSLVPTSVATVIILLFLIIKPWKIDFQPSGEAIAAENRLAIMYFENLAEPNDSLQFGEIATNLLITDLAESQYMQVVSSQRLYDILKLLGREGIKKIDKSVASEVAQKSRSRWLLSGSILQVNPHLILTSQIINISNGDVVATQRIIGDESQDIFSIVDMLSSEIKTDLALPAEAYDEHDPAVADVTTHSAKAYHYYILGNETLRKYYKDEAIKYFEKAIEYDSTFAMAYYALAGLKDISLLSKAIEYSDNVTWKEKHYIKHLEAMVINDYNSALDELHKIVNRYPDEKDAYYYLGFYNSGLQQYDSAIALFNKAIELDPSFKDPYNQLAYVYNNIGDFEKALLAIDKYIELAPNEPNPFDSKAEIYAFNGMIEYAIESYKKALSIKPDFIASLKGLALMYVFGQQYDNADSCINLILDTGGDSYTVLRYKALIPLFQGKFDKALDKFDIAINSLKEDYALLHYYKSRIFIGQNNLLMALKENDTTISLYNQVNPTNKAYYRYLGIQILAENGDLITAKEKLAELKQFVEEVDGMHYTYWYARGAIELAEGNLDMACTSFEKSRDYNGEFVVRYMLGKTYSLAERYEDAITEFEKIRNEYSAQRSYFAIYSVKLYYYLALAFENSDQYLKAIENYKTFLRIWKDADEGMELIDDAQKRVTRLTSNS
ncbi:MAG: tetratricopeptide repeat protein [candidate division Zixibacteria bacterium]|nr:tetratricopeptide repeat protein [candidate division Zixibacteria bacterium]